MCLANKFTFLIKEYCRMVRFKIIQYCNISFLNQIFLWKRRHRADLCVTFNSIIYFRRFWACSEHCWVCDNCLVTDCRNNCRVCPACVVNVLTGVDGFIKGFVFDIGTTWHRSWAKWRHKAFPAWKSKYVKEKTTEIYAKCRRRKCRKILLRPDAAFRLQRPNRK